MHRVNGATLLAAALAPLALGACAIGAHRAPDTHTPAAYEAPAGQAALDTAELDKWWLLFNDPALNALEEQAFRSAPDARTATARLLEARATRDSLVAQTLPNAPITGSVKRTHTENIGAASTSLIPVGGDTTNENLGLNISWELDFFGRLAEARRVANGDLAATRFNAEGARASLAANVADNYFQVRGLAIQLADARETARIQAQLQAVAQKKADIGLGPASDADRVAGDLAQARSQVANYEAELHAAQRVLLVLIGRGVDAVETIPSEPVITEAPPPPEAVPGELLARRPDVREAEARLQSAAGRDKLAHLAIFPTFTIMPGAGLTKSISPGVSFIPPATLVPAQQTTSTGFWSLGLSVTQPLLDIPRLMADMRTQDARTEQAVIAYEKAVQTAYGEAENALVRLAADQRRIAILKDGEARARRAYDAARIRYGDGIDDLQTALGAETAWRSTRTALSAEQVQALRRAVQTYKALGGGWAYSSRAATP